MWTRDNDGASLVRVFPFISCLLCYLYFDNFLSTQSLKTLHSVAVLRHESGRYHSFLSFLTNFLSHFKKMNKIRNEMSNGFPTTEPWLTFVNLLFNLQTLFLLTTICTNVNVKTVFTSSQTYLTFFMNCRHVNMCIITSLSTFSSPEILIYNKNKFIVRIYTNYI